MAALLGAMLALPAAANDEFDAYHKHATKARRDDAVMKYTWDFLQNQGSVFRELLGKCSDQHSDAPKGKLQVIVSIRADGSPDAILVQPDAEFSRCVARGFAELRFPAPPDKYARKGLPMLVEVGLK